MSSCLTYYFPRTFISPRGFGNTTTIFVDMLCLQSLLHLKNSACFFMISVSRLQGCTPSKIPTWKFQVYVNVICACVHAGADPHTLKHSEDIYWYPEFYAPFQKIQTCLCQPQPGRESGFFYGVGGGSWVGGWVDFRNVTTYLAGRCVADVLSSCTGKAKRRGYKVQSRQNDFRPPNIRNYFHLTSQTLIKAACHEADRQTQKQRTEKDVIRKTKWYHTRTGFIKRLGSPLPHTHTFPPYINFFFLHFPYLSHSLPHQDNEDTPILTYYQTRREERCVFMRSLMKIKYKHPCVIQFITFRELNITRMVYHSQQTRAVCVREREKVRDEWDMGCSVVL